MVIKENKSKTDPQNEDTKELKKWGQCKISNTMKTAFVHLQNKN